MWLLVVWTLQFISSGWTPYYKFQVVLSFWYFSTMVLRWRILIRVNRWGWSVDIWSIREVFKLTNQYESLVIDQVDQLIFDQSRKIWSQWVFGHLLNLHKVRHKAFCKRVTPNCSVRLWDWKSKFLCNNDVIYRKLCERQFKCHNTLHNGANRRSRARTTCLLRGHKNVTLRHFRSLISLLLHVLRKV